MLGTIGQSNIYVLLLPLIQPWMLSGQNQNSYSTLLKDQKKFLRPLYVGVVVPCLPIPILALHIVHVMACIVQHRLAKLDGNLAMCHLKTNQSVSNIDVV